MKKMIAVGTGVTASVLAGPAVAASLGFEATDGFDSADVVCILLGMLMFFVTAWALALV